MTLSMQVSTPQNGRIPQVVRALLLDDSTFDRARIRRLTKDTDVPIQLDEVGSIQELQSATRRSIYDLIMIDYRLPVGSGLNAVELLQQDPMNKDAAIIMITGNAELETAVAAMRMGCHDFLTKDEMTATQLRVAMLNALKSAHRRKHSSDLAEDHLASLDQGYSPLVANASGQHALPATAQAIWTRQDQLDVELLLAGLNDDDEFIFH